MNLYLNLKPNNYGGEADLLTVEIPSADTEDLMKHVRPIAEQKDVPESRILKDIIKQSITEIERRSYDKSRKNKKRR